jgi:hypothetical protein
MSFESEWIFLRAALPDLQEYILSSEVYWTLRPPSRAPGGVQIPQLTIGNLLLSHARLAALPLSAPQNEELAGMARQWSSLRDEWRANWGVKAGREFSARLNLWQQYLRELRADGRAQAGYYAREIRNRAILRILWPEIEMNASTGVPDNEKEQFTMLDTILRGLGREGSFVWEPEVQDSFPKEGFWFLYLEVGKNA